VKCYIWSVAVYSAVSCTLRKVDRKYPESFEICEGSWRPVGRIV